MLEAEAHHVHMQALAVALPAEEVQKLTAELSHREGRGIQHIVGVIPHRLKHLPLQHHRLLDAPALCRQGVGPAGLLIAVDDGVRVRVQKQQAAGHIRSLQPLQRGDQQIKGLTRPHVVHQRHPVIVTP